MEKEKICRICNGTMKLYEYAYDNSVYGKVYYKCDICGHKENIIEEITDV